VYTEGSEIFLILAGRPRPIMMNSALEGLRQRRLDDTQWEIWLPQRVAVWLRWKKRPGRGTWRVGWNRPIL